jgi:hypothetical protein
MKNGKNPTVRQKKLIAQQQLNYEDWLVVKDTSTEMVVVRRDTGALRTITK